VKADAEPSAPSAAAQPFQPMKPVLSGRAKRPGKEDLVWLGAGGKQRRGL